MPRPARSARQYNVAVPKGRETEIAELINAVMRDQGFTSQRQVWLYCLERTAEVVRINNKENTQ